MSGQQRLKQAIQPIIAPRRAPAFTTLRPPRAGESSVRIYALNTILSVGNSVVIHREWDAAGREILIQHKNSGGTVVAQYRSDQPGDFDAIDNRHIVRELAGSEVGYGNKYCLNAGQSL